MDRRGFLKGLGSAFVAAGAVSLLPSVARAAVSEEHLAFAPPSTAGRGLMSTEMGRAGTRALSLVYPHEGGEAFQGVYWQDGQYVHNALSAINELMRDRHHGAQIDIDPSLLDLCYDFALKAGINGEMHIISGYREDARAWSRRRRGGTDSLHAFGQAIDLHVPGHENWDLVQTAWDMQRGGVGYYGGRRHIHIDVGDVRRWGFGSGSSGGSSSGGSSSGGRRHSVSTRKPSGKGGSAKGNTSRRTHKA